MNMIKLDESLIDHDNNPLNELYTTNIMEDSSIRSFGRELSTIAMQHGQLLKRTRSIIFNSSINIHGSTFDFINNKFCLSAYFIYEKDHSITDNISIDKVYSVYNGFTKSGYWIRFNTTNPVSDKFGNKYYIRFNIYIDSDNIDHIVYATVSLNKYDNHYSRFLDDIYDAEKIKQLWDFIIKKTDSIDFDTKVKETSGVINSEIITKTIISAEQLNDDIEKVINDQVKFVNPVLEIKIPKSDLVDNPEDITTLQDNFLELADLFSRISEKMVQIADKLK